MESIYKVEGKLNREFVGQIAYSVSLEGIYNELVIDFSYDNERFLQPPDDLKLMIEKEIEVKPNFSAISHKEITRGIMSMKTELQLTVMMNDTFIGTIHRGDNPKHIKLSRAYSTPGFIPQPDYQGNIRIIVVAFSVIRDETKYALELKAGE